MSDYMPTTDEVRNWFSGAVDEYACDTGVYLDEAEAGFDRWLDQVRAEERERIAQAIEDANAMYSHGADEPQCPTACIWEVAEHAARIARRKETE